MFQRRRLGFATNSSSSHSIVLLKDPVADRLLNGYLQYGWESFILSSPEEKAHYFLTAYLLQVEKFDSYEQNIINKWLGLTRGDLNRVIPRFLEKDYWIDHQSCITFPKEYGRYDNRPDFEYLMALKKEIIDNPNIAILGGNDNCDPDEHLECDPSLQIVSKGGKLEAHPLLRGLERDGAHPDWVVRKDSDHWVKFNYKTGEKIHFGGTDEVEKADTPELVDIKITERCNHKCDFCYQSSNPTGSDASEDNMRNVISALHQLKVFEVALGGGDPLLHPNILSILGQFRENYIVPNFSTRSYRELLLHSQFNGIIDACGSIGLSVEHIQDIEESYSRLLVRLTDNPTPDAQQVIRNKFTYHIIVGVTGSYTLEQMLGYMKYADFKVLLLGPKFVGRGAKLNKKRTMDELNRSKKDIIFAIKEYPGRVAIDTSLAMYLEKDLRQAKADTRTFFTEEGKFSMYIDAVQNKCAPSSFSDKVTVLPKMSSGYPRRGEMETYVAAIQSAFASY